MSNATSVRRYHVHGAPSTPVPFLGQSENEDDFGGGGRNISEGSQFASFTSEAFLSRFYRNALVLPDGIHSVNYISWTKVIDYLHPTFELGETLAKSLSVTPFYRQPGVSRDYKVVFPPRCETEVPTLRNYAGCAANTDNSVIINWFASGAYNSSSDVVRISVGQGFGKDVVRWEGAKAFINDKEEIQRCTFTLAADERFTELRKITDVHVDDIARIVAHNEEDVATTLQFDEGVKKKNGVAIVDSDNLVARYIHETIPSNKPLEEAVEFGDDEGGDGEPRSCSMQLSVFNMIVDVLKKEQSLCKPRGDLKKLSKACVRGECDGDPTWSATVTFGMLVAFVDNEGEKPVTTHFFNRIDG